jgi:hypothetical protein
MDDLECKVGMHRNFPFHTKARSKTYIGIEVSFAKCG